MDQGYFDFKAKSEYEQELFIDKDSISTCDEFESGTVIDIDI